MSYAKRFRLLCLRSAGLNDLLHKGTWDTNVNTYQDSVTYVWFVVNGSYVCVKSFPNYEFLAICASLRPSRCAMSTWIFTTIGPPIKEERYMTTLCHTFGITHDDVIQWKHFRRYWTFVRWIPRSPVNSPFKGRWRGALVFSLICSWTNG